MSGWQEATLGHFINEAARELFKKIRGNQLHIRTLEKLRDTLLPKLMGGEIRVAV